MTDILKTDIDRRGFLRCMAWAGSGVVWTMTGGVPSSNLLGQSVDREGFQFVQISDSHIGFNKPANSDVNATLQLAIDKINGLPKVPDFLIHTGDLTHLAKPSEFDTLGQLLQNAKAKQVFYVPGEHDTATDDGKEYLARYGKGTKGSGWYSFDHRGVHFVGLVNSAALEGMGKLGAEQLAWLKDDLRARPASMPVVVFAHIPLWSIYPEWGWGTSDSEQALGCLRRWLGDGAERAHPPNHAESGRQRPVSHRHVDRISAASPGDRPIPGTNEGALRKPPRRPRNPGSGIGDASSASGDCGFNTRMKIAIVFLLALGVVQAEDQGKTLFVRRCSGCHAPDLDKEGPHLRGVYGGKAASSSGFDYSEALKKSSLRWDDATLDRWLADPSALVPDTDMAFRLADDAERKAIISYLKTLSNR